MPSVLDELEPIQRGRVFAAATERLSADPLFRPEKPEDGPPSALIERAIEEARLAAKFKRDDESRQARLETIRVLTTWIRQILLPPGSEEAARDRLSDRGSLDLGAYTVEFGEDFDSESKMTGISRSEFVHAVRNAQVYQHFPPLNSDATQLVTMLTYTSDKPRGRNTLLVDTRRTKDKLFACNAWRLFHDEFELSSVQQPLDMLRLFVAKYGIRFRFAERKPGLLIERESIPLSPAANLSGGFDLIHFEQPAPMPKFHLTMFVSLRADRVAEVQLAYVVNISRYQEGQLEHGVRI